MVELTARNGGRLPPLHVLVLDAWGNAALAWSALANADGGGGASSAKRKKRARDGPGEGHGVAAAVTVRAEPSHAAPGANRGAGDPRGGGGGGGEEEVLELAPKPRDDAASSNSSSTGSTSGSTRSGRSASAAEAVGDGSVRLGFSGHSGEATVRDVVVRRWGGPPLAAVAAAEVAADGPRFSLVVTISGLPVSRAAAAVFRGGGGGFVAVTGPNSGALRCTFGPDPDAINASGASSTVLASLEARLSLRLMPGRHLARIDVAVADDEGGGGALVATAQGAAAASVAPVLRWRPLVMLAASAPHQNYGGGSGGGGGGSRGGGTSGNGSALVLDLVAGQPLPPLRLSLTAEDGADLTSRRCVPELRVDLFATATEIASDAARARTHGAASAAVPVRSIPAAPVAMLHDDVAAGLETVTADAMATSSACIRPAAAGAASAGFARVGAVVRDVEAITAAGSYEARVVYTARRSGGHRLRLGHGARCGGGEDLSALAVGGTQGSSVIGLSPPGGGGDGDGDDGVPRFRALGLSGTGDEAAAVILVRVRSAAPSVITLAQPQVSSSNRPCVAHL